jgi:glycerol-3-phosphate acyltransferase PlsY
MMLPLIAWIALALSAGYLLGSISFAVLVARSRGVDIFAVGSGNPGATNVKRVLGAGPGNLVFALDAAKGALAAAWPMFFVTEGAIGLGLWGLGGAILGHSFSIFLRFRGGKGVATTMGGMLVLMPAVLFISVLVWLLLYFASRVVAIASIGFGLTLPLAAMMTAQPISLKLFAAALALLLVFRHRANIVRLLRGEEHAFRKDKASSGRSGKNEASSESKL